jgi:hypothetical protein
MKLMTNFESRQSTKNQRQWILMSLSQGQCWGPYLWFRLQTLHGEYPLRRRLVLIAMELSYAAGSIGGFVVVGDMLLQDIICHKL